MSLLSKDVILSYLSSDFVSSTVYEGYLILQLSPLNNTRDGTNDANSLKELINKHENVLKHAQVAFGGILFRGWNVEAAVEFEQIALALEDELDEVYLGTSPRLLQKGCKHVFSASEFPFYVPIAQHCEMSFTKNCPEKIIFCCLKPSVSGGETPLCDYRTVLRDLPLQLQEKLENLGIHYYRSYRSKESLIGKIDPFGVKSWQEALGGPKEEKNFAEELCKRENYNFTWSSDGSLCMDNKGPGVISHPITKEKVFFNHIIIFHQATMFESELTNVMNLLKLKKWSINMTYFQFFCLRVFCWVLLAIRNIFVPYKQQPTFCTFGDGSEISSNELSSVRDAVHKNTKLFKWEKGDVIILDNRLVSHGRMPYTGSRCVLTSWTNFRQPLPKI